MSQDKEEQVQIEFNNEGEQDTAAETIEIEQKEAKEPEDRSAKLEEELRSVRTELQGLRAQYQPQQQSQRQASSSDPYEDNEKEIFKRQEALGNLYAAAKANNTATPEKVKEWTDEARKLDGQLAEVRSQRALAKMLPVVQAQAARAAYEQEHGDVYGNERALAYASAEFNRRRALGEPDSKETVEKAMNEARRAFNLAVKGQPTQTDYAQLSGTRGGGVKKSEPNKIVMGRAQKKMALAMYLGNTDEKGNSIDEQGAYKRWAASAGKRSEIEKRAKPGKWQ